MPKLNGKEDIDKNSEYVPLIRLQAGSTLGGLNSSKDIELNASKNKFNQSASHEALLLLNSTHQYLVRLQALSDIALSTITADRTNVKADNINVKADRT